uniref:Uncharacterized protein n=1 Tax=Populus alba TaxID=43335 RepID=A0A4U5MAH9_POPAL|nr:hypothetical protein D5086_0000316680 [Populus alba]
MQNCMASNGVQSYAGLQAALPPVSGVTQTIPNTVVQNPNMQSIPVFHRTHWGIQWDRDSLHYVCQFSETNARRPIFAEQFYNEKLVTDVLKTGVKEWLRVHGDHVKSEAVEKAITQIMMGEEAEEMSSRAKQRPGRLLKKVDLLAPISML